MEAFGAKLALRWLLLVMNLSVPTVTMSQRVNPSYQHKAVISPRPLEYVLSPNFQVKASATTRKYTFIVTNTTAALDGFWRPVLAINNQIPGPLIEVNEGDRLEITVVNRLESELTIHWHGLYQNGSSWEDGVTGITQCPITRNGGQYTYKFNVTGQCGTFWYHSHQQNLMADGISGPLIVHSVRDPLKRSIDFDQEVVLMLADWYHNMSSVIVGSMLSHAGYFDSAAAPSPSAALINGVGQYNCSFATSSQECQQTASLPQFKFTAGEKIRFRLINSGSHAMFFYSVDEHTLNITEADATPVRGPSEIHRLKFHNGQRYSATIKTSKKDAGKSFYIRATMDSDCFSWVSTDFQPTALAILTLVAPSQVNSNHSLASPPKTQDWTDPTGGTCLDLESSTLVPIVKGPVPKKVLGTGSLANAFGFEVVATGEFIPRNGKVTSNATSTTAPNATIKRRSEIYSPRSKRQVEVGVFQNLPSGSNPQSPGKISIGNLPPNPVGTVGKFFVNNRTWVAFPYQPVLHDLIGGGSGQVNASRVASVVYPTPGWYDLYIVNLDPALTHPYHLHGMDMHLVATGRGLPTQENLANLTYHTENPLRRDTVVVDAASFAVMRILANTPGVWILHCHIGWHLAAGFAGVVVVQPKAISSSQIPRENLALCETSTGPLDKPEPGLKKIKRKRSEIMVEAK